MSSIEWVAPPPSRRGGSPEIFTGEVRAALRARPGEWACVARSHKTGGAGKKFSARYPEFETTARRNPDKTYDLYARFVGEQS